MSVHRIVLLLIIITLIYLMANIYGGKMNDRNSEPVKRYDMDPNQIYLPIPMDTDERCKSSLGLESDSDTDQSSDWTSELSKLSKLSKLSVNNSDDPMEKFTANGMDNPVIDQGTMENGYALLSHPLTGGGVDIMSDSISDRKILHQIPNTEYIYLVTEIKDTIASKIIERARTCQEMHGTEAKPRLGDGKRALTLACETDPYSLQDDIIDAIYELIYQYVKKKFGINLNPYLVHHDLYNQLNLLEGVIYPLQYSGRYTVHGVQYTNEDWIRNKVQADIDVRHALFSVISRRNIEIEVDTDQNIH
jgi:hypothetical protein